MVDMDVESILDAGAWSLSVVAPSGHDTTPLYDHYKACTVRQLHARVVESDAVSRVIKKMGDDEGRREDEAELRERAMKIMTRMGQDMSGRTINMLAVIIRKMFLTLFTNLKVNRGQLRKLRDEMRYSPVVFVPTHRSYMDFLLLSFVLHCEGLPVPAIAAGEDFLGMAGIAHILRWSGAFFIRRSFFDDNLYRAIFTEYVQQLITNGTPLEFFIEGTRSRSGKALSPKFGMLQTASEPFFANRVADIHFVPVSISFERQVERELYPVELLGTPKPKESLRGLIKARSVLDQDYGTVHVVFGDSISLNKHSKNTVCRMQAGNVESGQVDPTVERKKRLAVKMLGYRIISAHRALAITTLTALVASVVARMPREFSFAKAAEQTQQLYEDMLVRGGRVDMGGLEFDTAVRKGLTMLDPHVHGDHGNVFHRCSQPDADLVFANYRNQISHLFVHDAVVMVAAISCSTTVASSMYAVYKFLHQLMVDEFVLDEQPEALSAVAIRLRKLVERIENGKNLRSSQNPVLALLPWFVWPILDGYAIVVECMLRHTELLHTYAKELPTLTTTMFTPVKDFLKLCGMHARQRVEDGACCSGEAQSSDVMKVAVTWVRRFGPHGVATGHSGVVRSLSTAQAAGLSVIHESIIACSLHASAGKPDLVPKSRL